MKKDYSKMVFHWCINILLTVFIFLGFFIVWSVFPRNPIHVDAIDIDKIEVYQGEELCMQIRGEKLLSLPVTAIVELVDGRSYVLAKYESNTPVGTHFPPRCFEIPENISPRKYKIRWTGIYDINHLQRVTKTKDSEWIEVLKREKDKFPKSCYNVCK